MKLPHAPLLLLALISTTIEAKLVELACPDAQHLSFSPSPELPMQQVEGYAEIISDNEPTFILKGLTKSHRAAALTHSYYQKNYLRCHYRSDDDAEILIEVPQPVPYPTLAYCYFIQAPGTSSCASATQNCHLLCESL